MTMDEKDNIINDLQSKIKELERANFALSLIINNGYDKNPKVEPKENELIINYKFDKEEFEDWFEDTYHRDLPQEIWSRAQGYFNDDFSIWEEVSNFIRDEYGEWINDESDSDIPDESDSDIPDIGEYEDFTINFNTNGYPKIQNYPTVRWNTSSGNTEAFVRNDRLFLCYKNGVALEVEGW